MKHLLLGVTAFTCSMSANAQSADFNDKGVTFGHVHLAETPPCEARFGPHALAQGGRHNLSLTA